MATKQKKTAYELEALMMVEIRRYPELNNIQAVGVVPPAMPTGGPTWECNYVSDGPAPTRLDIADEIKRKLQDEFDLL